MASSLSLFPPLRVLSRNKESRDLAILPYNSKHYSVLLFQDAKASFLSDSEFDDKDFFSLTECFGCIGIVPIKKGIFLF